ncbi:sulfurtransferase [Peribacillus sp. ACCC06369]|uniref:sulfurtransferase n=1 Tax=Peribacillus sp. ACCC06369 TaxID=3055860 RepID=UPI0025A0C673|nr:sulfurtransferase [Peribacillus sp. ACCC06369]
MLIIIFVILVLFTYKLYVPVKDIPCQKNEVQDAILLDIRAFNHKCDDVDKEVLNIPYAYLKRFNEVIPHENIHVIASDKLEVNLGLRFLIGKGIKVTRLVIVFVNR